MKTKFYLPATLSLTVLLLLNVLITKAQFASDVPTNITAPLFGPIIYDYPPTSCPWHTTTTWGFCQHQSGGHITGGIGGANDTYAWDCNLASNADNGVAVYPAEDGYISHLPSWAGSSYGQLLIRHVTGGVTWYSGYLHMNNITSKKATDGTFVSKNEIIGNISNVSPSSISSHLHFAVYYKNSSNQLISVNRTFTQKVACPTMNPLPLSSPSNFQTGVTTPVNFSWSSVSGADAYRINVSTSSSGFDQLATPMFPSTLVNQSGTSTFTSYTWTGAAPGTTYYWVVRYNIPGCGSAVSEIRSFTTASTSSPYCSGQTNLTGSSGSFTDGSGANNYADNSNCSWLIQPTGASTVSLNFTAFSTESGYDFVRVYDGTSSSAIQLGSFSGSTIPSSITSSGGSMYVQFTTDGSQQAAGWSASYTSTTGGGGSPPPCSGGVQFPGTTLTPTSSWQTQGSIYAGEYSVFNVVNGQNYIWSLCSSDGGNVGYDAQLTLRNHSTLAYIAYSDDVCGTEPKISWTANFTGQVRVLVNQYTCLTNSINTTLAYKVDCSPPNQPAGIGGNTSVCQGSTQTYIVAAVLGATSYTWSLPSGWSGSSSGNSIICSPTANGGTISVIANNSCGSSAPSSMNVSILVQPPQPNSISGFLSVCEGSTQTYSIPSVAGATSYSWSLPSGWTGSSTSTSITCTVGASSGNISVSAVNGCGAGIPRTLATTINALPAQPLSISGNTTMCQGTSQTYSIPSVAGATSYAWSLPSGWSGSSTSTSITCTVGTSSGNVSVSAVNSCGSGASHILSTTVLTIPLIPSSILGNTNVCQGSSQTYSIPAVAGASIYSWSLPSGWIGSSTTTSITYTIGSLGGVVSVTGNNICGISPVRNVTVVVSALPTQPSTITGNTNVCQGSTQTYSIPSVAGASSYSWSLPSGWSGSSTTTSITCTVGASSGNVSVSAVNGCGTGTARTLATTVSVLPTQPSAIIGNTSVCQGSTQTYSIPSVAGATSYVWSLPSGWSGSSTSTSITCAVGASSGNVSVSVVNGCGTGTARTLATTVSVLPNQPSAISGNTSVCQGSTQTYSIPSVVGASSYSWSLPSGWSGSSTTTSITCTVGASSGNVSVSAVNGCGTGAARTLATTVSVLPNQPSAISGNTSVCQGSSQTYSIPSVVGASSYSWSLPSGWSGSSTTTSITCTVGASSGNVSVSAVNGCGTGTARTLATTVSALPTQPSTITGNTNVCQGSSQTYSIPSVVGATSYVWSLPSGWSGSSTSTSITCTVGASSGNVSVSAVNGCGTGMTRTLVVSVGNSNVTINSTTNTVCYGSSVSLNATGANTYSWSPGGFTGATINVSPLSVTTYTVIGTSSNGCLSSATKTIMVNNNPSLGTTTTNNTICVGQSTSIAGMGASSYLWLPGNVSGSPVIVSPIVSTIYTVTGTASNGCTATATRLINVSPCNTTLQIKCFIAAYYQGSSLMRNVLQNQNVFGATSSTTDSIIVEIRNPNPPYLIVSTQKRVMQTNGLSTGTFNLSGNYYLVIKHRNAVQTWSSLPITLNGGTITYDFTNQQSKAFGNNQLSLGGGLYGFYSGDVNQEENINLDDLSLLQLDVNNFASGYFATDINGDGNVDLDDILYVEANNNNFIFSNHP